MSLQELWRRLAFRLQRRARLRELDEEMRLHVELRERQLRNRGLPPDQAAHAARRQFGRRVRIAEDSRDAWGWSWLDGLVQDLRYAGRLFRASPWFTAVVVLTLALGIGPNTAMFSVMNAVVLRALPVPEPERVVYVQTSRQPDGTGNTGVYGSSFSYAVYAALRERRDAFSDLITYVPLGLQQSAVRHGPVPEEARAMMVSGNFFTGLGVGAACGRVLTMDDEAQRAPAVVLSHAWWSRRFNGHCGVVGETLRVKGVPFTIVGVAAPAFTGVGTPDGTDLWIPLQDRPELEPWGMSRQTSYLRSPDWWNLMLIGRLAAGVSQETALARLQPVYVHAAYAHLGKPKPSEELPRLELATTQGIAGARDALEEPLRLLTVMVALVLAIACGNVALLLVARHAARQREFAVRAALGGGRVRLLRQLLAESVLLVAAAAVLGWLFAVAATRVLATWSGAELDFAPDARVLLFTVAISALVALVFGLLPFRSAIRLSLGTELKTWGAAARHDRRRTSARKAVIALQMALCLILLVGAGLLARTLRNLEQAPLGMRATGLLTFGVSPRAVADTHPATVRFYETLLDRLRALPGVESVTLMENRLGSGWSNNGNVFVDGAPPNGDSRTLVRWNLVGPDYFRTLQTPLLYGRDISERDTADAQKIAVVNRTFVARHLSGRNPLDHTVALSNRPGASQFRIVGVAEDSKYTGVRESPVPMAYFSYKQMPHVSAMHVEARTTGDAAPFLRTVQQVVREIAPDLPLEQPRTQQEQFARSFAQERLLARLALFFGLLATVLVATGVYGTLAYMVSRRRAEIGVRMALGAARRDVMRLVLRESLVVCLAGVALGLPLAIAGSRSLRALLFDVTPGDPFTFLAALALLGLVALAASLFPALRAASIDPVKALRLT